MDPAQTRAQLVGLLGEDEVLRNTGRHLRRLHRRGFRFFRGGAGTGAGIVLIIAGICALVFIIYSIWLRRKKQHEKKEAEAERMYQQQVQNAFATEAVQPKI